MQATLNRRDFVLRGSVAAAAAAFSGGALSRVAFGVEQAGDEVLAFVDTKPADAKDNMLRWEDLTEWITPNKHVFDVSHYGTAKVDADTWRLELKGFFDKPATLSLAELKSRPKRDVMATLECSGNGAAPSFVSAVGNVRWTGTPLADLLKECGLQKDAIEVAFWGADQSTEKIRGGDFEQNFARCLSIPMALREDLILAYEMNGEPLPVGHGAPLRLVVPGWYGIAWVKWLTTIEARDRRLMNRFMARDYVTLRGTQVGDKVQWKESSVGPMNIKSFVARAVRHKEGSITMSGAAWSDGTPIKSVEVKIDGGDWQPAKISDDHDEPHTWRLWSFEWKDAKAGEHTLVSRATDARGRVQPSADDPAIKLKKTYWEANGQYPRKIKL